MQVSGIDSPQRREPRQDRARERVDRILQTTAELLREDGVEALTMSRVAARAESTLPSVYRYFPDRTHLLRALAEHYLERIHAALAQDLASLRTRDDARAALAAALVHYYEAFDEDRALREIWAGTLADTDLVELNIADSRRNGALLAERLGPFTDLADDALLQRCVLIAQLSQATIAFAVSVGGDEGRAYVDEFGSWTELVLLPTSD